VAVVYTVDHFHRPSSPFASRLILGGVGIGGTGRIQALAFGIGIGNGIGVVQLCITVLAIVQSVAVILAWISCGQKGK
jgi:hypothetical protein